MEPEVLWDGPLFADEIGWPGKITDTIVEQYDLDARRIILGKEANKGMCTIYFRPPHWDRALVRFANRYRAIVELILREGLSGERRLLRQGWLDEDIAYFFDIIPNLERNEYSPIVYKIVLQSLTTPDYLEIARELDGQMVLVPRVILRRIDGLDVDNGGLFDPFVRHHLVERATSTTKSVKNRGKHTATKLDIELEEEYRLTAEGESAIPAIPIVYEEMIVRGDFEPLDASVQEATAHLPEEVSKEEIGRDIVEELMRDISADGQWE